MSDVDEEMNGGMEEDRHKAAVRTEVAHLEREIRELNAAHPLEIEYHSR